MWQVYNMQNTHRCGMAAARFRTSIVAHYNSSDTLLVIHARTNSRTHALRTMSPARKFKSARHRPQHPSATTTAARTKAAPFPAEVLRLERRRCCALHCAQGCAGQCTGGGQPVAAGRAWRRHCGQQPPSSSISGGCARSPLGGRGPAAAAWRAAAGPSTSCKATRGTASASCRPARPT